MFQRKLVVITGGSSGVGQELAGRLADRGASLVLLARDEAKLEHSRALLQPRLREGARLHTFSCDVTDRDAVLRTFDALGKAAGAPEILINSAGILREGYFQDLSPDTFREIMDINFFGALHCIQAVLPVFERAGRGWIVNISSLGGLFGVFGYAAYCSSKYALVGLSDVLRQELKPLGVKVQLVCPPEFESPMVDALNSYRSHENRAMVTTVPVMTLAKVTDAIVAGMERGQYRIVPGPISRLVDRLNRWAPWLSRALADARLARVYRGPGRARRSTP